SGTTVRVVAQTSAGQRHSRGLADYAGAALAVAQPSSVNHLLTTENRPYLFSTGAPFRRARRGPWSLYRGAVRVAKPRSFASLASGAARARGADIDGAGENSARPS